MLSAKDLIKKAQQLTDISLDDADATAPLAKLCQSLNEEANLHYSGCQAVEQYLIRILANRLRMQRDIAAHPEILEQQVLAPLVVCGMGRTGSTKTQKLLAATGDFNWLPFWQSYNPSLISGDSNESTEARIESADNYNQWFDSQSPEAKYGHEFDTHEPNEESWILEHSLYSSTFLGWFEVPSFLQWLTTQDMSRQFTHLRDTLKYLQWQGLQDPNKRWVLKCPLYFGLEPLLLQIFPDACLVMTHREPVQTIPSTCKLLQTYHQPFTEPVLAYPQLMQGLAMQMDVHLSHRETISELQFLDIYYRELIDNSVAVVKKVYAHAGMDFTSATQQSIEQWEQDNPQNKKGAFKYALADYGFSAEDINQHFQHYNQLLAQLSA